MLLDAFPGARIVGADNSEEMLLKARKRCPEAEFVLADASGDLHEFTEKFDLVFSNACLQWLPDHRRLLPRLMALLGEGGTLAVQIPMQREHPVHRILGELVRSEKWKGRLVPRKYNNLTTEEYFDVLSGISGDFELWETVYCHRMPDYESIIEWYRGTGLRPYLEQLCEADGEAFTEDVYAELKKRYKPQENGEILFRFPRLFFTAARAR